MSSAGHASSTAENGQIALEMAAGQRFDLIVMDVNMPVMDGLTATRGIRAGGGANAETPIVVLSASARTEEELLTKVRDARARIAFYASTPGYAAAFEHLGLGDLAAEVSLLSKRQDWEELPRLIDDEVLHEFVTIGTYDVIGDRLVERYGDVVTDIEFSIAVRSDDDRRRLAELARQVRAAPDDGFRANLLGT